MVWAVAARYSFPPESIWSMTPREFMFWYDGHVHIYNEEIERMKQLTGGGKKQWPDD